jgi:hypothetical protein
MDYLIIICEDFLKHLDVSPTFWRGISATHSGLPLARDSEIGCPDAQDGFRNALGNLIATIRLSVGKCVLSMTWLQPNIQQIYCSLVPLEWPLKN